MSSLNYVFKYITTLAIFNTKRVSSGPTNEGYYIGDSAERLDNTPEILWEDICFIEDEKMIWTHGTFYTKEEQIPTKITDLINDSSFITLNDVSLFDVSINNLDSSVQQIFKEVEDNELAIVTYIDIQDTSINANSASISLLENSISDLDDNMTSMNVSIATLNTSVNTIESNIAGISDINASIVNINSSISTLNTSVNTIEDNYVKQVSPVTGSTVLVTDVTPAGTKGKILNLDVSIDNKTILNAGGKFIAKGTLYRLVEKQTPTTGYLKTYALQAYGPDSSLYDDVPDAAVINIPKDLVLREVHLCKATYNSQSDTYTETSKKGDANWDSDTNDQYLHFIWHTADDVQNTGLTSETYIKITDLAPIYEGDADGDSSTNKYITIDSSYVVLFDSSKFSTDFYDTSVSPIDASVKQIFKEVEDNELVYTKFIAVQNGSINANTADIETLQSQIGSQTSDMSTVNASINRLNSSVTALENAGFLTLNDVSLFDVSINNLDSSMQQIFTEVENNELIYTTYIAMQDLSINTNAANISTLEQYVLNQGSDMSTVNASIARLNSSVTALENAGFLTLNDVSLFDVSINNLDSSMQQIFTDVERNELVIVNYMGIQDGSIAANTASIDLLSQLIGGQTSDLSTINTSISLLNTSLNTIDSSLQQIFSELIDDELTYATYIGIQDGSINANTININTLQEQINDVSTVNASIINLNASIINLNASINTLNTSVNALELTISIIPNLNSSMSTLNASVAEVVQDMSTIELVLLDYIDAQDASINAVVADISVLEDQLNDISTYNTSINSLQTTKADVISYVSPVIGSTITINSNTYYNLGTVTNNLSISLAPITNPNIYNEYMLRFIISGTPTITWPNNVTWLDGTAPEIENGKTYEISIVDNLGVYQKF